MKTLDMADKYEPLSYVDEYADPDSEPTVKIQVPSFHPQVVVDERDTIPCPPPFEEKHQGPNWGALAALAFCLVFWGTVAYLVWR